MKERIDNLLVKRNYFTTRQKAKFAIENKNIYVNNILVEKSSKLIEEDANIEIKGKVLQYVSRGGLKLEKALTTFNIQLHNKICIDIGASTGGFTDCMIQNGAQIVYAIDVGNSQLDESLVKNPKVINLENTNIKEIDIENFEKVNFISIDVSFISLIQVLDIAYRLLKEDSEIVILIKPQFEAGIENINKNGIVKSQKIQAKVIEKIVLFSNSLGFQILGLDYSPIKGIAGNIEYLCYMKKKNEKIDLLKTREKIKQIVEESHKKLNKEVKNDR